MKQFDPGEGASIASITDKVRPLAVGMPVSSVHFLGETAVFVGAEENATIVGADGEMSRADIHGGATLCATSDGARIVTGGDDGQVVALNAKGEEKFFDAPSTVGGLAFAPKGVRLAIAHYNGVSLWFPNMAAKPEFLEWAGSHLAVTFSPDNKFLVTAMHEPALHGWRLADNRHMRMSGYPGRVRSMSWSAGGKGLATSSADTVIVWPFASKDGPMGKEPAMLAPLQARVSAVACHPKQDILAAGYGDGTVLMVRLEDGAEILVRRNGGAAGAGLAWNAKGTLLAYGAEDGDAGVVPL